MECFSSSRPSAAIRRAIGASPADLSVDNGNRIRREKMSPGDRFLSLTPCVVKAEQEISTDMIHRPSSYSELSAPDLIERCVFMPMVSLYRSEMRIAILSVEMLGGRHN